MHEKTHRGIVPLCVSKKSNINLLEERDRFHNYSFDESFHPHHE